MGLSYINHIWYRICGISADISRVYNHYYLQMCRAAGYSRSSRATPVDFLLSLVPLDPIQFYFLLVGTFGIFRTFYKTDFLMVLHHAAMMDLSSLFSIGFLAIITLSTLAWLCALLRLELVFLLQIGAGAIGLSLTALAVLIHRKSLLVVLPESLWAFTFLVGVAYSNRSYRVVFFPLRASWRMRSKHFPPRQPGRYRILLIEPAMPPDFRAKTFCRCRYLFTTPYLAALLPGNWDPMIVDVIFDEIDYDIDTDVVAITSMAMNFDGTAKIARKFLEKGKTVIFGGADPSQQPDMYLEFSSSVLVGAGEGYFPRMLSDWENNRLQRKYINPEVYDLKGMPIARYDLLPLRRYMNWHPIMVSTSCPYKCSFCAYNRTREPRLRPVEEVVKAIEATPARYFWFEAPELLVYKDYVRQLEKALRGKKVEWGTHATMKSCSDASVLRSAYAAGLRTILIGVESYNQETLSVFNKKQNVVSQYPKTFELLDQAGISVTVHIIFGCFTDKLEDFKKTLVGLTQGKAAEVILHIMTTFAGDEEFRKMLLANGGVEYQGFQGTRHNFKFYRSPNLSDQEMARGMTELVRDFYSPICIFKRICLRSWRNLPNFLPDLQRNISRSLIRRDVNGFDFDFIESLAEYYDQPSGEVRERYRDRPLQQDGATI